MVVLRQVSEKYRIKFVQQDRVCWEEIWALRNISLEVKKGEVVGVIGHNGAGKTTLLKLIAGMLIPDEGDVTVEGKVSTIMELGAGFNPEFTGRENIGINARVYGIDEKSLAAAMEKIVAFADLGKFIDAPVKFYSQGMYARLAFSLAVFVNPDVLLIDDILTVGDEEAKQKCLKKLLELKGSGTTVFIVSHDMEMIRRLCGRVVLLEKGRVVREGGPEKVVACYLDTVGERPGIAVLEKESIRAVFNNGRLSVYCDDQPVTRAGGCYSTFVLPGFGIRLTSSSLRWSAETAGDAIRASGYSGERLAQTWEIRAGLGRLDLRLQNGEAGTESTLLDVLLPAAYTSLVTFDGEFPFPAFLHPTHWQELARSPGPFLAGFQSQEAPPLVVRTENGQDSLGVYNSGYEQESRIAQARFTGCLDISFLLFNDRQELAESVEREKTRRETQLREEAESLRAARTLAGRDMSLYCDLDAHSLRLYWKGIELTSGQGIHSTFLIGDKWYDTSLAEWSVRKEQDALVVGMDWKQLDFSQTWKFTCEADGGLRWQTQGGLKNEIKGIKYGLFLVKEYRRYFCGHQEGEFPGEFGFWQDFSLEEPRSQMGGVRRTGALPALAMKNSAGFGFIIQNSDESSSVRALQLGEIAGGAQADFSAALTVTADERRIEEYIARAREARETTQKSAEEQQRRRYNLENGPVRLFCDLPGRSLRLFYRDREITTGAGIHMSYSADGIWYDDTSADWEVNRGEESLSLAFRWKRGDVCAFLTFFYEGSRLCCEGSIGGRPGEIKTGIFMNPAYSAFFCGIQQDDFPEDFGEWKELPLAQPAASMMGVRRTRALPAVMINNEGLQCRIQNSDSIAASRILQLALPAAGPFTFKLEISEDESGLEKYLERVRREERRRVEAERALLVEAGTIASESLRLEIDPGEKTLRLFYRGKAVSGEKFLDTEVALSSEKRIYSDQAAWTVRKDSPSRISLFLDYSPLPLRKEYSFSITGPSLDIAVTADASRAIPFADLGTRFQVEGSYVSWRTGAEQGDIPQGRFSGDIAPVRLRESKVRRITLDAPRRAPAGQLSFESLSVDGECTAGINVRRSDGRIYIHFVPLKRRAERSFPAGRHEFFSGRMVCGPVATEDPAAAGPGELPSLVSGNSVFRFDYGRGRFFHGDRELTAGMGFYTSVKKDGIWHDSYRAAWDIRSCERRSMRVSGDFLYLPVSQHWLIEPAEENRFRVTVTLEVFEEIVPEILQANLMLSAAYTGWSVPGSAGTFLQEFTSSYDILPFRFWYGKAAELRAQAEDLPGIAFFCAGNGEDWRGIVENSDDLFGARLVQFQHADSGRLKPGTYPYFQGTVGIGK